MGSKGGAGDHPARQELTASPYAEAEETVRKKSQELIDLIFAHLPAG